ncbi:cysteine hydrolase [Pseudaestuariivita sp.]|uniref:cysteine hydrolase n=1 Tax=Pseudaestuariivita sp. TaxID=2211669 RepID=UPI00405A2D85
MSQKTLAALRPERTALLIVDLQNDFLDAEGAYGRAGQSSEAILALPERVAPLAKALRAAGGSVISTQFTLVPGPDGAPLISPHLKLLRPFLGTGDFAPGAWGHALVDTLQPADYTVEKVAYSAFYMTRLEWLIRKTGIETLLVCGIVTNGGVAATVRDAHVRDIPCVVLEDGCAAFSAERHDAAISDLSSVGQIAQIADALAALRPTD